MPHSQLGAETAHNLRNLLNLIEFQLHRSGASENCDHHLQRFAVFIHFVNHASECRKRAFSNAHAFVFLELNFELGLVLAVGDFVDDVLYFFGRERGRLRGCVLLYVWPVRRHYAGENLVT